MNHSVEMVWARERMGEHRMTRRVLEVELIAGLLWSRPRLGWMEDVKVETI